MASSVRDLKDQLVKLQYNPSAAQRAVLQTWADVSNGKIQIVDPSNPVVLALESAAVMMSVAVDRNEVLNRRQYPLAAQDQKDLYFHMSDKDYVGRFAIPVATQFKMLLPHAELLNRMVLDPTTGIKKVVVPRNTNFEVADTRFGIQYPIEIRQLQHGGLQVVYDTTIESPIQTLTTNVLEWEIVSDGSLEYLQIVFDVLQVKVTTRNQAVNKANLFQYSYAFDDQFCYARVYVQNADKTWKEIATTHSAQVYDVTSPTAVLQVDGQELTVTVPQVYTANGLVSSVVRTDIYSTKGNVHMVLGNYEIGAYSIKFENFDKSEDSTYQAPLGALTSKFVFSQETVDGGSNGVPFATLKRQVINNSVGPQKQPISNVNLTEELLDLGYEVVTDVDNITNRQFLATRPLPDPVDSDLITAAGATNATVSLSLDGIAGLSYVARNGDSLTITPDALYKNTQGVVTLVNDAEIAMLQQLPSDQKALLVTNNGYLYTPFHYVLDASNDGFAVRPYYLDSPEIETKVFVSDNDTTLLQVNTAADYGIVRTPTGYKIQILTQSGQSFKDLPHDQVFVQLAYVPAGENSRAYLNGTLVQVNEDGERVYEFDLSSNLNVTAGNNLELTKFLMFTLDPRITAAPLSTTFDVIYSTNATMDVQWTPAEVDGILGRFLLPNDVVGITHEQLKVHFGDTLDTLWARARSVISTIVYQTWDVDVPRRYQTDQYVRDPQTGSVFSIGPDGQLTYNISHYKGDPVVDDLGQIVYQYRVGDIKLDAGGNPIPANPRGMTRQIDFMLIEGVYRFATDTSAAAYRTRMIQTLLSWITVDLHGINDRLLEQSELFFYPKKSLGTIDVMYGAGQTTTIEAGQALTLRLYVSKTVYNNSTLRKELQASSVAAISQALTQQVVSRSAILASLRVLYGNDVIDVELEGLGGAANLDLFTVLNASERTSLRKRLVAQSDDSLIATEDLTVDWVLHELS